MNYTRRMVFMITVFIMLLPFHSLAGTVDLPATGRYRFLETDILTADLTSIFDGAAVVVHLAAITDATNSFQNKETVERVNFTGTSTRGSCPEGAPGSSIPSDATAQNSATK